MPFASPRIGFIITIIALLSLATSSLRADLVWDAQNGWRIEGGALTEFVSTPEGRNAKAIMDSARRAEDAGRQGAALSGYKRVAKKYSGSVFAPEALYRSARIYKERRQFTKAYQNLQTIVNQHPAYERFSDVLSSQYRIAEKLAQGTRPRYFGVIPGFRQREKGIEYFEIVVFNAPYSEYAPLALMNAAAGYTKANNRDFAIDALDRMINNYPDSFLTSDAYLKLAAAQASITQGPAYDQASTQLALTYFQDYLILYPGDLDAGIAVEGFADARTMLAESKMTMGDFYYFKRSNYKAAKVFYNEAITIDAESATAERARKHLARIERIEAGEDGEDGGSVGRSSPRSKRFWIF